MNSRKTCVYVNLLENGKQLFNKHKFIIFRNYFYFIKGSQWRLGRDATHHVYHGGRNHHIISTLATLYQLINLHNV